MFGVLRWMMRMSVAVRSKLCEVTVAPSIVPASWRTALASCPALRTPPSATGTWAASRIQCCTEATATRCGTWTSAPAASTLLAGPTTGPPASGISLALIHCDCTPGTLQMLTVSSSTQTPTTWPQALQTRQCVFGAPSRGRLFAFSPATAARCFHWPSPLMGST